MPENVECVFCKVRVNPADFDKHSRVNLHRRMITNAIRSAKVFAGSVTCRACLVPIKSEEQWKEHLGSTIHTERLAFMEKVGCSKDLEFPHVISWDGQGGFEFHIDKDPCYTRTAAQMYNAKAKLSKPPAPKLPISTPPPTTRPSVRGLLPTPSRPPITTPSPSTTPDLQSPSNSRANSAAAMYEALSSPEGSPSKRQDGGGEQNKDEDQEKNSPANVANEIMRRREEFWSTPATVNGVAEEKVVNGEETPAAEGNASPVEKMDTGDSEVEDEVGQAEEPKGDGPIAAYAEVFGSKPKEVSLVPPPDRLAGEKSDKKEGGSKEGEKPQITAEKEIIAEASAALKETKRRKRKRRWDRGLHDDEPAKEESRKRYHNMLELHGLRGDDQGESSNRSKRRSSSPKSQRSKSRQHPGEGSRHRSGPSTRHKPGPGQRSRRHSGSGESTRQHSGPGEGSRRRPSPGEGNNRRYPSPGDRRRPSPGENPRRHPNEGGVGENNRRHEGHPPPEEGPRHPPGPEESTRHHPGPGENNHHHPRPPFPPHFPRPPSRFYPYGPPGLPPPFPPPFAPPSYPPSHTPYPPSHTPYPHYPPLGGPLYYPPPPFPPTVPPAMPPTIPPNIPQSAPPTMPPNVPPAIPPTVSPSDRPAIPPVIPVHPSRQVKTLSEEHPTTTSAHSDSEKAEENEPVEDRSHIDMTPVDVPYVDVPLAEVEIYVPPFFADKYPEHPHVGLNKADPDQALLELQAKASVFNSRLPSLHLTTFTHPLCVADPEGPIEWERYPSLKGIVRPVVRSDQLFTLIGVNCIDVKGPQTFYCSMCKISFDDDTKLPHLEGKDHRLNVIWNWDPKGAQSIKNIDGIPSVADVFEERLCEATREIEKKEIVLLSEYQLRVRALLLEENMEDQIKYMLKKGVFVESEFPEFNFSFMRPPPKDESEVVEFKRTPTKVELLELGLRGLLKTDCRSKGIITDKETALASVGVCETLVGKLSHHLQYHRDSLEGARSEALSRVLGRLKSLRLLERILDVYREDIKPTPNSPESTKPISSYRNNIVQGAKYSNFVSQSSVPEPLDDPYPSEDDPYASGDQPHGRSDVPLFTSGVPYPVGGMKYPVGDDPYPAGDPYSSYDPYDKRYYPAYEGRHHD